VIRAPLAARPAFRGRPAGSLVHTAPGPERHRGQSTTVLRGARSRRGCASVKMVGTSSAPTARRERASCMGITGRVLRSAPPRKAPQKDA
jgi:hypothetical protein